MRFVYPQWAGSEFPTQEHLSQFMGFVDYVMEYGDEGVDALASRADKFSH
ncbi:MAG: hypothetical protein Q7R41_05240 [Phycisphaerales bacterium]|nr:hypothetical protein [Phycisphaerales bacterium]